MKKTQPLKKNLSLSKETIRSLVDNQLGGVVGGIVVVSDGTTGEDKNSCNSACPMVSCQVC
jgi:hypothetical protein